MPAMPTRIVPPSVRARPHHARSRPMPSSPPTADTTRCSSRATSAWRLRAIAAGASGNRPTKKGVARRSVDRPVPTRGYVGSDLTVIENSTAPSSAPRSTTTRSTRASATATSNPAPPASTARLSAPTASTPNSSTGSPTAPSSTTPRCSTASCKSGRTIATSSAPWRARRSDTLRTTTPEDPDPGVRRLRQLHRRGRRALLDARSGECRRRARWCSELGLSSAPPGIRTQRWACLLVPLGARKC